LAALLPRPSHTGDLKCCAAALLQVSRPSRAASYIIAAGSLLTEEPETAADLPASSPTYSSAEIAEAAAAAERALSSASASTSAGAKKGASKWVIDESENLKSTLEHRLWTYGCLSILGASLAGAAADIHSPGDAATVLGSVFAAYVLSDFGTAVYHWAVDNYGDGNTPVFGRQIAAFQGHHQRPWTITQREFCNNVHQVRTCFTCFPVLVQQQQVAAELGHSVARHVLAHGCTAYATCEAAWFFVSLQDKHIAP
jgi:ubiquitin-conjugating enzyme E2 variant